MIFGILFQVLFNIAVIANAIFVFVTFVCAILDRRFLLLCLVALSALNTSLKSPIADCLFEREFTYQGTVVSEDHLENGTRLGVNLEQILLENDTLDYGLAATFFVPDHETYLGRTIIVRGRVRAAKSPHNVNVLTGTIIRVDSQKKFPRAIFYGIRCYIDNLFRRTLNYSAYNIAAGLILGGSSRVGEELQDVFTRAGVLHILSVSGFNVGFVISFVTFLIIFIPISNRIKFLIIVFVLFLYAGITGFQPSVSRASLMACLFGAAFVFQRNVDAMHILNITALALLIINPLLLFDVGAELSFASVYGILILYPKLEKVVIQKIECRFLKISVSLMAISFSAQLFVSPMLVQYFHRLQTLAIFSNLLIVPLASIITYLLFSSIILGTFSLPLAQALSVITSLLISLLVEISKFFARIPISSVSVALPLILLALFYFLFVARLRRIALYMMFVLAIIFALAEIPQCLIIRNSLGGTLITMPNNEKIMIMKKRNVRFTAAHFSERIDYLIAPEEFLPAKKEFISIPDELEYKKIKLGNIDINIDQDVRFYYQNMSLVLESPADQNEVCYVVTNGKKMYSFATVSYPSFLDYLATDFELLYFRLRFLFS